LALLGVLLLTALVPGHVVSQATALTFGGDAESAAEMPCHDDTAMPDATGDPNAPDTPQKKCPFCKGYASFMNALAGSANAGTIDNERVRIASWTMEDGAVEHIAKRTKNRGPPPSPMTS